MKPTPTKKGKKTGRKVVKAWSILDLETGELMRYPQDGKYEVSGEEITQKNLHHTFKPVRVEIHYTPN